MGVVGSGVGAGAGVVAGLAGLVEGGLPSDYVEFLRSSNGAHVDPQLFVFASPWGVESSVVTSLFGVADCVEVTNELRGDGFLPPTAVVIGEDPGGNYLVLSAEVDSPGVFFWDHERANPQQLHTDSVADFAETMTLVAPSFTEFVDGLVDRAGADRRWAELAALPLPAMPTPAAEVVPEPSGARKVSFVPGPLRGSPGDIQVYRPSTGFSRLEMGVGGQFPDALNARAIEFPVDTGFRYSTGLPLFGQWVTPTLRWLSHENATDFPYAAGLLTIRPHAGETLRPIFERYGELLPVDTEAGPLWLFRCLNIVDALAPTVRYEEGYRGYHEILDFDFVPDKVEGAGIFVIPKQAYAAEVFFTRDVAQEFLDADVRCPPFVHIWSVEAGV